MDLQVVSQAELEVVEGGSHGGPSPFEVELEPELHLPAASPVALNPQPLPPREVEVEVRGRSIVGVHV